MTEGVGKRIVDALKRQSEGELVSQIDSVITPEKTVVLDAINSIETEIPKAEKNYNIDNSFVMPQPAATQPVFETYTPQPQASSVSQTNIYSQLNNNNISDFGGLEVPANVAILRQLISQLPSGVSRQAGALVIKQTMEALGISMKSVLQEAQQLQENINSSARDCQNSILECKKQINTLEAQVQKYQKQSASLNDIVSLFLQIN